MNYVIAGLGVVVLLMGGVSYFLYENQISFATRLGAAETQLKAAVQANQDKTNATKQRATTERTVRQLPDPDLVGRLR